MSRQLSAKDLAFEKEREKYKKRIRELEHSLMQSEIQYQKILQDKISRIAELETQVASQEDWIRRLLDYTQISKADIQKIVSADIVQADATLYLKHMRDLLSNVITQAFPE